SAILQLRIGHSRGPLRCGVVVSPDTAAVAGISGAPAVGANLARSAPPRSGSDPADVGRLGGPYVWPALGIAGQSRAVAAVGNAGGAVRGDGDHPASAYWSPNGFGVRTGCGARSLAARRHCARDRPSRPAR